MIAFTPMSKRGFLPQDPAATHARFAKVKARALKKAEDALRALLRAPREASTSPTAPQISRRRPRPAR